MDQHQVPATPIVIFDEFLVAQELRGLLDFTLGHSGEFVATQVIGPNGINLVDGQTRRSSVLYDFGLYQQVFIDRLLIFLPHVLARLGYEPFEVSHVEVQLTATNNGEYFRVHNDNDANAVRTRAVTFVYFFHREPRSFYGGELRIFDTHWEAERAVASGPYRVIYPLQNQIVFFPSYCLHEILPVGCVSGYFADSRFTVNGWIHR
jgi:Rps23 Pro-64 3,4-dihydroxylase Tpa1-like proline 4-hydroxylase